MRNYSVMLDNSHEVTVRAPDYNTAVNAALEAYPESYVVGTKLLPEERPADDDREGGEYE